MIRALLLTTLAAISAAHAAGPSFDNLDLQLSSLAISSSIPGQADSSSTKARLGFAFTKQFNEQFFVQASHAQTVGSSSNAFIDPGKLPDSDVGIGMLRMVSEFSAVYGGVGARSTAAAFFNCNTGSCNRIATERKVSPRISAGFRSRWNANWETDFGVSTFESAADNKILQVGAKGTYYFSDSVGALLELGSADGDSSAGVGMRIGF